MDKKVKIPIRIKPSIILEEEPLAEAQPATEAALPSANGRTTRPAARIPMPPLPERDPVSHQRFDPSLAKPEATRRPESATTQAESETQQENVEMWRDRALRLQAEIDNARKRQQRLAEARIAADRERLLRAFLGVADDLERALNASGADVESLREGVNLTQQALTQLLKQEGVEPILAEGKVFDPTWHEAVGTVPHQNTGVEPDTVVQVMEKGYRLADRLLRPARVVVAI